MNNDDVKIDNELLEEISNYLQLDSRRYDGGAG